MKPIGRPGRASRMAIATLALALAAAAAPGRAAREYNFDNESLDVAVRTLAADLCMRVEYDEPALTYARGVRVTLRAANTTPASALARLLDTQPLGYEYGRGDTLMVFPRDARPGPAAAPLRAVEYDGLLSPLISRLAEEAGLSVDAERSKAALPRRQVRFSERNTSAARALHSLLAGQGLTYERDGCGAITIVRDATVVR